MDIENHRQKPNILVTGTPGVGKSTLGKLLSEYVEGFKYVDVRNSFIQVGKLVNEKKLFKVWNQDFNVPEFDEDLVIDELEDQIQQGGVIVDFHTSAFFPERVSRCHIPSGSTWWCCCGRTTRCYMIALRPEDTKRRRLPRT